MIPDRRSLVDRVSEALIAEIAAGHWEEWLPQERSLALNLGVSRNTLRAALSRLRKQGLIEPIRGKGHRLIRRITRELKSKSENLVKNNTVVVLAPEPLDKLRPTLGLLIAELREILLKAGLSLEFHNGKHYYRSGSPTLLTKLVSQRPAVCWILIRASEGVQRWFGEQKIPCLLSGSAYPGMLLPSVDADWHAVGAHAAGRFLGLGHRRLLLVLEDAAAGLGACERGFREMVERTPQAAMATLRHSSNIEELRQLLTKQMRLKLRPTGILVASSYYYLTVSGTLHQLGLRVPVDVSLICTDADHFLPYMVPEACHYDFRYQIFARKLAQKVNKIVHGQTLARLQARLFPSYIPGASVAAPPGGVKKLG
ncbi:hypothetical protein BH09VER1_BH09VER1_46410 [soil metagenome]